jgi:hypothetical protein
VDQPARLRHPSGHCAFLCSDELALSPLLIPPVLWCFQTALRTIHYLIALPDLLSAVLLTFFHLRGLLLFPSPRIPNHHHSLPRTAELRTLCGRHAQGERDRRQTDGQEEKSERLTIDIVPHNSTIERDLNLTTKLSCPPDRSTRQSDLRAGPIVSNYVTWSRKL